MCDPISYRSGVHSSTVATVNHVAKLQVREGELVEDAPNYNRIDATVVWMLWDVLGAPTIPPTTSTKLHKMFTIWKDQISPSGVVLFSL
jgi:hypothetical protein